MAVHHGKNGKVKLTANVVAETTKWSVTEKVDVADTTAQGDSWKSHLASTPEWSAKIDGNYDPADTNGQVALAIGASVTVGLYSDGDATGKKYKSGTATVTEIGHETDVGDRVQFSCTLMGNGALTTETVPA